MSPNAPQKSSTNVALIVVAIVFSVTLAAAVIVFAVAPEGSNTVTLIGALLGTLAPTIAALAVLVQVKAVAVTQAQHGERIDRVAEDTYALTNGLLDSKVRAGVADVMRDDLLDPAAEPLVDADKRAIAEHHDENGAPS